MNLYVGNLSFSTTDPDLKDLFAQYGTVTDVHLVTDRMTGKSRGFAFVTMSSAAEGKAAISALEGKNFDGRNLTVNEARPKDEGQSALLLSRAGRHNPFSSRQISLVGDLPVRLFLSRNGKCIRRLLPKEGDVIQRIFSPVPQEFINPCLPRVQSSLKEKSPLSSLEQCFVWSFPITILYLRISRGR